MRSFHTLSAKYQGQLNEMPLLPKFPFSPQRFIASEVGLHDNSLADKSDSEANAPKKAKKPIKNVCNTLVIITTETSPGHAQHHPVTQESENQKTAELRFVGRTDVTLQQLSYCPGFYQPHPPCLS